MPEPILKPDPVIEKLQSDLDAAEHRLRRANSDFQEFVSRVSHDLREPLRTVGAYCELLAVKNAGHADEDAKLFTRYILDGVQRAQSLLTAMVEYASAQPEKRHPTAVDMNAIFFEATRRVKAPEGAAITHDSLPTVVGDFDPLAKVMVHLIDNAIKFAGRPDAKVHVSARPEGYDWIISVQDNGPGIDPRILKGSSVFSGVCMAATSLAAAWVWRLRARPLNRWADGFGWNRRPVKVRGFCSACRRKTDYRGGSVATVPSTRSTFS